MSERHELPGWAQCAWTWLPTEACQRSDGGAVSGPFKVKADVVRDWVSDWAPLEPPRVPQGAPSVVSIVLDDGGYSAMSRFRGPIDSPNLDWIAGEDLGVGRYRGAGVTRDYPGQLPWRFTAATITLVAVDVSGESYVDLERETATMMMGQ